MFANFYGKKKHFSIIRVFFKFVFSNTQTFNFAENGRHLSNQKYKSCIRQESKMCSITYEPCNEYSFRIGPNRLREATYPNLAPSPYSGYNGAFPYQSNPYQMNPFQVNPYYPNPALNSPIIGPNGMLIPNPYTTNGILPPNRIVYDANGAPSLLSPNGMLTPISPNALTGKSVSIASKIQRSVNIFKYLVNCSSNEWNTVDNYNKWSR